MARFIYLVLIAFLLKDSLLADAQLVTKPITSMCLGGLHSCVSFNNNKFKCTGEPGSWGSNLSTLGDEASELGDGLPYVNVGTAVSVTKVGCGSLHTCVKLASDDMKCMGFNQYGQAGIGVTSTVVGESSGYTGDGLPVVNLGSGIKVLDIAVGYLHVCAKVTGIKVKCFGANNDGQLGQGDKTSRGTSASTMGDNLPAIDFGTDVEVASLHTSSSSSHNCVILSAPSGSEQRAKCWGDNIWAQLGYGDNSDRGDSAGEMGSNLLLIDIGTESKVKQFSLGNGHTCALLVSDDMKCWGYGTYGTLGLGSTDSVTSPASASIVPIDSGKKISTTVAGNDFNCVLLDDALTVKCVGKNDYGQLGVGDTTKRGHSSPTTIPNLSAIPFGTGSLSISSIYAGSYGACVVFADNTVRCFGLNEYGQFAIGNTDNIGDAPNEMGTNLQQSVFFSPTKTPTNAPVKNPTKTPTTTPTKVPTNAPTKKPTLSPVPPTSNPSKSPTKTPTKPPSKAPTKNPTKSPSEAPVIVPTANPQMHASTTAPSTVPTKAPTKRPTREPTESASMKNVSMVENLCVIVGILMIALAN